MWGQEEEGEEQEARKTGGRAVPQQTLLRGAPVAQLMVKDTWQLLWWQRQDAAVVATNRVSLG